MISWRQRARGGSRSPATSTCAVASRPKYGRHTASDPRCEVRARLMSRPCSILRMTVMAALAVLVTGHVAVAQVVDFEGRYWFTELEAHVKTTSDAIPGSNIDLTEDLGVEGI